MFGGKQDEAPGEVFDDECEVWDPFEEAALETAHWFKVSSVYLWILFKQTSGFELLLAQKNYNDINVSGNNSNETISVYHQVFKLLKAKLDKKCIMGNLPQLFSELTSTILYLYLLDTGSYKPNS